MPITTKVYLGDGVYAHSDGFHEVVLETEREGGHIDTIYLDSETIYALCRFLEATYGITVTMERKSPE